MLTIRLQRVGRRNDPAFRVIVTDKTRGPKSGNYTELVGSHNPRQKTTRLNKERIEHWLSHGAQVSGTVHNLLVKEGVIEGKKVNVLPKKSPTAKATEETEETKEKEAAQDTTEKSGESEAVPAEEDKGSEVPSEESAQREGKEAPVEENSGGKEGAGAEKKDEDVGASGTGTPKEEQTEEQKGS